VASNAPEERCNLDTCKDCLDPGAVLRIFKHVQPKQKMLVKTQHGLLRRRNRPFTEGQVAYISVSTPF
jgi:hypothetical protein